MLLFTIVTCIQRDDVIVIDTTFVNASIKFGRTSKEKQLRSFEDGAVKASSSYGIPNFGLDPSVDIFLSDIIECYVPMSRM